MIPSPVKCLVVACVVAGVAGASTTQSLAVTPAPTPAAPCGAGYEGQAVSTLVGQPMTFRFEVPGAIPAGHGIRAVRIAWGDGTQSAGRASTRSKPQSKGCYVTVFSARHAYKHVSCRAGVCSSTYHITLRYRDAKTKANHTNGKLQAIVLRPPPKKK